MNSDTELLCQQRTAQKKLISPFKTLKPLAVLIIILIIVLVAGYLLGIRANQNASQDIQRVSFQASPTITSHSPSSKEVMATPTFALPTSNMKVYRNERLGFEFKHLEGYKVVEETTRKVSFGPISTENVYLSISTGQITDYKSLKPCEYGVEPNVPCLRVWDTRQEGTIIETTLGGVSAISFDVVERVSDRTFRIVQTTGSPKVEAKMLVSGGGLGWQFIQMLSTFKFLDNI